MSKFAEGMGSFGFIVDDPDPMGSRGFILPFDINFGTVMGAQSDFISDSYRSYFIDDFSQSGFTTPGGQSEVLDG